MGIPPTDQPQDKQTLCIEILTNGHVQAFVDFFYLTHRPEDPFGSEPEQQEAELIPQSSLPHVKEHLAEAEVARRRGDTKEVFASYKRLADFFTELADQRTAIYFWDKCLEITRLTSDTAGESQATRALGMANEVLGETAAAVKYYEKLLRLAISRGDTVVTQQANEHLVVAYQSTAAELETAGELHEALVFREKCLDASRSCDDRSKESLAHFELGGAHEKLADGDNLQAATSHYMSYLSLSEQADNTEAQGAACCALARVYQRLGDTTKSVEHLQKFLALAQASGKLSAQADAACSLAVLHNQQGDFTQAVSYFESFFELARSIGDRALLDKARSYLGIARGNSVLSAYTNTVTNDLEGLLKWKNRRVPFTPELQARAR